MIVTLGIIVLLDLCRDSKNVKILGNTRIQSHSFICENVSIGKNCFIGHSVNFINDKFYKKTFEKNFQRQKLKIMYL